MVTSRGSGMAGCSGARHEGGSSSRSRGCSGARHEGGNSSRSRGCGGARHEGGSSSRSRGCSGALHEGGSSSWSRGARQPRLCLYPVRAAGARDGVADDEEHVAEWPPWLAPLVQGWAWQGLIS